MAQFPALPLWTDAYLADTTHLTLEQHGAYLKMLIVAWRSPDCSLPADDKMIARYLGVSSRRWELLKPAIMPMWSFSDGKLTQKRLKTERERVERSRRQRIAAGEASAKARGLKIKDNITTDVHCSVQTPDPTEAPVSFEQPYPEPEPYRESPLPPRDEDEEILIDDGLLGSPEDRLCRQHAAEAIPPNLLMDREKIIGTVMAFHISRANAEMLVNGARDHLSRQELVDLIQSAKIAGFDRDKLEEVIVSAVAKKKRESTKMVHNTAVGTEAMRQWGKVSQSIRARIGEATWKTFIAPIRLESVNGEGITIRASTVIAKELRSTDLAESIAKLWAEESGQATTVQILEQS